MGGILQGDAGPGRPGASFVVGTVFDPCVTWGEQSFLKETVYRWAFTLDRRTRVEHTLAGTTRPCERSGITNSFWATGVRHFRVYSAHGLDGYSDTSRDQRLDDGMNRKYAGLFAKGSVSTVDASEYLTCAAPPAHHTCMHVLCTLFPTLLVVTHISDQRTPPRRAANSTGEPAV